MPSTGREQETSFPLHWGPLYRKTTLTKAKFSSGPFPAIYFLTCRHGTNWCLWEKNRSEESFLITMESSGTFESLRWWSHLFLAFQPMLDWSKQLKGKLFAFKTECLLGTRHICHLGKVHITGSENNVFLLVTQRPIKYIIWDWYQHTPTDTETQNQCNKLQSLRVICCVSVSLFQCYHPMPHVKRQQKVFSDRLNYFSATWHLYSKHTFHCFNSQKYLFHISVCSLTISLNVLLKDAVGNETSFQHTF